MGRIQKKGPGFKKGFIKIIFIGPGDVELFVFFQTTIMLQKPVAECLERVTGKMTQKLDNIIAKLHEIQVR